MTSGNIPKTMFATRQMNAPSPLKKKMLANITITALRTALAPLQQLKLNNLFKDN
jgi:hypothetical protein